MHRLPSLVARYPIRFVLLLVLLLGVTAIETSAAQSASRPEPPVGVPACEKGLDNGTAKHPDFVGGRLCRQADGSYVLTIVDPAPTTAGDAQ